MDYVPLSGLPFVIIADDKRVYLGTFWSLLSSSVPSVPAITIFPPEIQKNVIRIQYPSKIFNSPSQSDPRSNQLIYDALKSVGKIRK